METACGYLEDKVMWLSTDERKMINRITKLMASHPNEIRVIARPEENGGCLYVRMPADYLKISPPRRCNMSDEEKVARAERLKLSRKQL